MSSALCLCWQVLQSTLHFSVLLCLSPHILQLFAVLYIFLLITIFCKYYMLYGIYLLYTLQGYNFEKREDSSKISQRQKIHYFQNFWFLFQCYIFHIKLIILKKLQNMEKIIQRNKEINYVNQNKIESFENPKNLQNLQFPQNPHALACHAPMRIASKNLKISNRQFLQNKLNFHHMKDKRHNRIFFGQKFDTGIDDDDQSIFIGRARKNKKYQQQKYFSIQSDNNQTEIQLPKMSANKIKLEKSDKNISDQIIQINRQQFNTLSPHYSPSFKNNNSRHYFHQRSISSYNVTDFSPKKVRFPTQDKCKLHQKFACRQCVLLGQDHRQYLGARSNSYSHSSTSSSVQINQFLHQQASVLQNQKLEKIVKKQKNAIQEAEQNKKLYKYLSSKVDFFNQQNQRRLRLQKRKVLTDLGIIRHKKEQIVSARESEQVTPAIVLLLKDYLHKRSQAEIQDQQFTLLQSHQAEETQEIEQKYGSKQKKVQQE